MGNKKKNVHQKSDILTKLVKDLHEFKSDEEIADIARRIMCKQVFRTEVCRIRERLSIEKQEGYHRSNITNKLSDRYDHKKVGEFLDNLKKQSKIK